MKKTTVLLCIALLLLPACSKTDAAIHEPIAQTGGIPSQTGDAASPDLTSEPGAIPFTDNQLYAAALVGCGDLTDLTSYLVQYTDANADSIPIHIISGWEYYLIIPRYPDMDVKLYKNDMETDSKQLVFEQSCCGPFLIQCNISDIFPDATVSITYNGETVEFSPYVSLQDGSVLVGERGLNLTE